MNNINDKRSQKIINYRNSITKYRKMIDKLELLIYQEEMEIMRNNIEITHLCRSNGYYNDEYISNCEASTILDMVNCAGNNRGLPIIKKRCDRHRLKICDCDWEEIIFRTVETTRPLKRK